MDFFKSKFWFFLLFFLLLSFVTIPFPLYSNNFPIIQDVQYITLDNQIYSQPKVLEFFSFYCSHCYQFEDKILKKIVKKNIKIVKYHVSSLGPMGKLFTHAWALSIALGIENQISHLIFKELHEKKRINTLNDIKNIFNSIGITDEEYFYAWNSLAVRNLIIKQEKAALKFPIYGIPVIFINGKYMIKNEELDTSSLTNYTKHLIEIIDFLLNKK